MLHEIDTYETTMAEHDFKNFGGCKILPSMKKADSAKIESNCYPSVIQYYCTTVQMFWRRPLQYIHQEIHSNHTRGRGDNCVIDADSA